jgi:hypothetical protein
MKRQDLIQRLVSRKIRSEGKGKALCICLAAKQDRCFAGKQAFQPKK